MTAFRPDRSAAAAPGLPLRWWAGALLASLLVAPALAQGVYRIVGPDGRVTFSDQPPPTTSAPARGGSTSAAPVGGGAPLPFELRQVVSRYPVTLYSASECAPCNAGRNLLNSRGVPFTEKTVNTAQDSEALKRLSGDTSLPFMTIGSQQLKGFSDTEWTQFLDAAGYPKQSALPSGYRRPAPAPLVTVKAAEPAAATPAPANRRQPAAPEAIPVTPPTDNPAGIRF